MATVAQNAARLLAFLVSRHGEHVPGLEVANALRLLPDDVNDAATILVENGYAEWVQWLGTSPFHFGTVSSTPRGKFEYERNQPSPNRELSTARGSSAVTVPAAVPSIVPAVVRPPAPIGSPYGFHEEDWEIVTERKSDGSVLYVVLGHQFTSTHFTTEDLRTNVRASFERAVAAYNASPGAVPSRLAFCALGAGYGEHLFNEIARDIISADIALFDTSDLNPNVMLEMGVALTWGVRVLAIKKQGCPKPPSDVSGQTWADYHDSGRSFADPEHDRKLLRMVDRAVRTKGRRT